MIISLEKAVELDTKKTLFYNKYAYSDAPVVRVAAGPIPGYIYLSSNFEQETENGYWKAITGEVLLLAGTDQVFTVSDYPHYYYTLGGLPATIATNMTHRRGTISTLADSRYRCDGIVFSKDELISLSIRLRPEIMGMIYPVDGLPSVFSFHEVGDTYMKWSKVFINWLLPLATQSLGETGIIKTLYRTNYRYWEDIDANKFLVGYQTSQGPEFLEFKSALGLVDEWPTEELLQVFTKTEQIMAGLFSVAPPKKKGFFHRLGFGTRLDTTKP